MQFKPIYLIPVQKLPLGWLEHSAGSRSQSSDRPTAEDKTLASVLFQHTSVVLVLVFCSFPNTPIRDKISQSSPQQSLLQLHHSRCSVTITPSPRELLPTGWVRWRCCWRSISVGRFIILWYQAGWWCFLPKQQPHLCGETSSFFSSTEQLKAKLSLDWSSMLSLWVLLSLSKKTTGGQKYQIKLYTSDMTGDYHDDHRGTEQR